MYPKVFFISTYICNLYLRSLPSAWQRASFVVKTGIEPVFVHSSNLMDLIYHQVLMCMVCTLGYFQRLPFRHLTNTPIVSLAETVPHLPLVYVTDKNLTSHNESSIYFTHNFCSQDRTRTCMRVWLGNAYCLYSSLNGRPQLFGFSRSV